MLIVTFSPKEQVETLVTQQLCLNIYKKLWKMTDETSLDWINVMTAFNGLWSSMNAKIKIINFLNLTDIKIEVKETIVYVTKTTNHIWSVNQKQTLLRIMKKMIHPAKNKKDLTHSEELPELISNVTQVCLHKKFS